MTLDEKFITYALNLAKLNLGQTGENPTVGCVICKDNIILATGITAKGGRPHAERIAIDKITNKAILKEATIYVTLEPCSHSGVTSPCVDEIIKHQFKRVVIATIDPDSRVNGQAIQKLEDAGIDVTCNIKEKEAQELNRAFFKARLHQLPFVTLKIATSLDGKIATKDFDSKWITSPKSRKFAHYLRATHQAIMVGANTIRKDNPQLDCRLPGLEDHSPQKIIISNHLDFADDLHIFKNSTPIILTSNSHTSSKAHIIKTPAKNDQVDVKAALQMLCQKGINSILVEGGQELASALLREDLVDEIIWIRNKKIMGNDAIAAIGDYAFEKVDDAINHFLPIKIIDFGDDRIEKYRR